jgi:hypothetical protein
MHNYNLGFISDEAILEHVTGTLEKYRFSIDLKKFNKNLIDPIKLTFDAKIYGKDISDIIESEFLRQLDKSNTNHIGYFHQNIFKYMGGNWKVPTSAYDIVNEDENIYIEMKNKHNTMNSSSSKTVYMKMQDTILKNPDAKCMLVEVIAKKSQNIIWKKRLDGQAVSDARIRRVSIDKLYELVTGDKFAFRKLCEKLPLIISDALVSQNGSIIQNTAFKELKELSPNLIKSIYLLSFASYEGFENLEVSF